MKVLNPITAVIAAIVIMIALLVLFWIGGLKFTQSATKNPNTYTVISHPFDTGGGTGVAVRLDSRIPDFANKGDTVYILKLK